MQSNLIRPDLGACAPAMMRPIWRLGRPPEVLALIVLDLLGGVLCLAGALAPPHPASPVVFDLVTAVVAFAFAVVVWTTGRRRRPVLWYANVVAHLVATSVLAAVAATGEGAMSGAFSYVVVSMFVATFFPRRLVRVHTALVCVASLVALQVNDAVSIPVVAWMPLALTVTASTELLAALLQHLRELTLTDALTGALNRRGFEEAAERARALAKRERRPLTVVVVDLDGFKNVNDEHGHAAGDALLKSIVAWWRSRLRATDVIARRGGDEFALLLPGVTPNQAKPLVAELRALSPTSWSYGIAALAPGEDLAESLDRADAQMYRGKRRDAVVV